MPDLILVPCLDSDGTITYRPCPCDGCERALSEAEIACGEMLCEECREEDERDGCALRAGSDSGASGRSGRVSGRLNAGDALQGPVRRNAGVR